jgi:hypothetical protein
MMPNKPGSTLEPVTINPRGDGSDRVPGELVYHTLAQNALASRILIDKLTPQLPKDNQEVTAHVKRLQAMLDASTVVDWHSAVMTRHGVIIMTTGRVRTGTRQAVSLHQRNAAEGDTRMTEICVTYSATEMHTVESKTGISSASILNRSSAKKGTMTTMDPIMANITDSILSKEDRI